MGIYDETVETARKKMVLFFLIDTSGSMEGSKIGAVNQALDEVIPEIKKISAENADAEIKVAAMTFSNDAVWLTQDPQSAQTFYWNYVEAEGMTAFGSACKKLNEKLSKDEFMKSDCGAFAPAIFLMSDGIPNDEWKRPLAELKSNKWFRSAIKVAVAIGDSADKSMLSEFTGTSETVMTAHTPEALMKMIRFVSVTASQIGSKSSGVGGDDVDSIQTKQDAMAQQIASSSADLLDDEDKDTW